MKEMWLDQPWLEGDRMAGCSVEGRCRGTQAESLGGNQLLVGEAPGGSVRQAGAGRSVFWQRQSTANLARVRQGRRQDDHC